jgi:AmmeMemoRadiSam system protein B
MAASATRQPAVAGQFYPASAEILRKEVESYVATGAEKVRAFGAVIPHAGYMYSGQVAGAVYARLELPERFGILCPNHTGRGEPLAIMSRGTWTTPLGEAVIDEELADTLKKSFPLIKEDSEAHAREHALEVQLPFLQVLRPDFKFVPITIGTGQFEVLSALGVSIGRALKSIASDTMIIASSDMNHYESDAATRVKDRRAIDQVLALDPRGLYDVVREHNISMCGYGPTVAMLTAAKLLGAKDSELVKYATSGDVSGDRDWVVGYAGMLVR